MRISSVRYIDNQNRQITFDSEEDELCRYHDVSSNYDQHMNSNKKRPMSNLANMVELNNKINAYNENSNEWIEIKESFFIEKQYV